MKILKCLLTVLILILLSRVSAVSQTLHLLATGDVRGYFFEENVDDKKTGGILERRKVMRDLQQKYGKEYILLFDTGDAISPDYLSAASSGKLMMDYMAEIGYDAMVVGNHEFDFGTAVIRSYKNLPEYPSLLGANIITTDSMPFLTPYKILDKGGARIGVIGITDPLIRESIYEKNRKGLIFMDVAWALKKYLKEVRLKSDVVILLTHLAPNDNQDIAIQFPDIDMIIGKSYSAAPDRFVSTGIGNLYKTHIFSTTRYGRKIPYIQFKTAMASKPEIQSVESIEIDSKIIAADQAETEQLRVQVEESYAKHCKDQYGLEPDTKIIKKGSVSEKDLKNYLLAMLLQKTESEIAFVNEAFFRFVHADTTKFDEVLTLREFERIFWIENNVVVENLTGEDIHKVLRRSEDYRKTKGENFLHVKTANPNQNLDYINIHGKPINKRQMYRVVTSNFLAHGGDGYIEFDNPKYYADRFSGKDVLKEDPKGEEQSIRKLFMDYLLENRDRSIMLQYRKPVWFATLRKIGFKAENKTKKNQDMYRDYSINELQGQEEVALSASLDLKLSRLSKNFNWENYIKSNYGVIKLGKSEYEEHDDNWSVESVVGFSTIAQEVKNNVSVFPYVSGKFQSEFNPQSGTPLRKDVFVGSGVAFSDFWRFSENRIGLVHLTRFSQNEEYVGNFGAGLHSLYSDTRSSYGNYSEFEFIYFFSKAKKRHDRGGADSASSNSRSVKFNWSSVISIEKWDDFYFNPGIYFFAFKGFGQKKWAYSFSIEFGLIFTTAWKYW
jgi:2',3'-cyclic-nucleotide 2'-phosphodiesterase (5'-nucleotidase family)